MTDTNAQAPITRLYQQCEPIESIGPEDPRWVNFDAVRGDDNVVALYARSLRRAKAGQWDYKLFTGHRGVGKTSELYRLKGMLETPEAGRQGFIVVFCDVGERLDVNDLDFPDLLVYIAAQLQQQLAERKLPGFSPVNTYLKRVWDDICGLLSKEVGFSGGEVEGGFGKLAIELRNRPNARSQLRAAVEMHSTSLLKAVNDLLGDAEVKARQAGHDGLVLIIDGLDKLVRRDCGDGTNTHERLFIDRSEHLASLKVHTVYTVPISLIYSPRVGQLEQTFGEYNTPVSMIRLRPSRDEPIHPDSLGMAKMREMVEKRCAVAETSLDQAFDSGDTLDYLCEMSGGHPRHLMTFIQAACNELDALPITRPIAQKAIRKYANALRREVPDDAWATLPRFDRPQRDIPKDDLHQQLLFLLFVFEYMNGDIWYEVNPVLRTLERFRQP
ncbi:hypothetical protein [Imhoffiella purpurea]|uniref:Type II secretory pathway, ATPase PulE/Tfp pilus assembly pathway, ATPase PilB n=1 Tax=Imhoffiella purpurea TaxID=1249627 RepID=W9VFE1_9GAMM|nr:hypothetical protein [Imhoffiella purpurea]EXJ15726.1 Type II secretory pathway, ATPase PulE/Tfp pilus assembly pathway, ATPase PilB [Imhoffiella purpurea]